MSGFLIPVYNTIITYDNYATVRIQIRKKWKNLIKYPVVSKRYIKKGTLLNP